MNTSTSMTMLDQILQILSPQKDYDKTTSRKSQASKRGRWKKKGKKSEKKPVVEEKKPYLDPDFFRCRPPPHVDLKALVRKPGDIDTREWIATHTISLFHNINLIYGTVSEFCTAETCPLMQGPCQTQYTWVEERGKKLKCTAAQYIDYVMTFCQKCISNQQLFPTKYAQDFHENFMPEIKKMNRFMFNVLAHLYYAHSARLRQLDMHRHLNNVFRHFIFLVRDFKLLDERETASLDDLVDAMALFVDRQSGDDDVTTTSPVDLPTQSCSSDAVTPTTARMPDFRFDAGAGDRPTHMPRGNGAAQVSITSFQGWAPT